MASILEYVPASNYSLFAIPAFYAISIAPRLYSIGLVQKRALNTKKPKTPEEEKALASLPAPRHDPETATAKVFGPNWRPDAPRSTELRNTIERILTPEDFQTYERAVAAHKNCMENLPLFFSAIIVANFPGVGFAVAAGPTGTRIANVFAAAYLFTRLGYIFAYLTTGGKKARMWPLRSFTYHASTAMCVSVISWVGNTLRKGVVDA